MAINKREIIVGNHSLTKREAVHVLRSSMTPAEITLWRYLRNNQWDGLHFRRQQIIDGFIVDFYCHRIGLIIEVDGSIHQNTVAYDDERTEIFERRGLRVLRLTNDQLLGDIQGAISIIRRYTSQGIR